MTMAGASPGFLRRLLSRPLVVVCLVYLFLLVGVAILAPLLLPHIASEQAGDLLAVRQGPSSAHLLGTDTSGRDVLERLLVGTRVTLLGVAQALLVAVPLGVLLGIAAGYLGGRTDRAVSWCSDLVFSMPGIIIVLVVLSVFPQSMTAGMVTLGVLLVPGLMRVVRSATLPVKEELYIAAADVDGLSRFYIMTRHILPRVAGPIIVQVSLLAAVALMIQTGLAFLGLVAPAPQPSWGGMVGDGIQSIVLQPWLIWPPGMAIAVTILVLGLLGDAARDASAEGWSSPAQRRRHRAMATAPALCEPREDGTEALLSVRGLTITFARTSTTPTRVVDNVSFEIRPGETVGLVGESGCGKTATASAVLGILPGTGRIASGQLWFRGDNLATLPEKSLARIRGRRIGFVSQEPMVSLNPVFRIGWQLGEVVRRHQRCTRDQARTRVLELLRQVQLPDPKAVARSYPHELSGGMAQRVVIARALAGVPDLLIADEPTTALDVTVQAEILDLLRTIQSERQMAMLLVTHDWGVVADICDRAVVMYAGQIVEQGDLRRVFRRPLHPYTEALLASNPQNHIGNDTLVTIAGNVPRPGEWPTGCHFHPRCGYATELCRQRDVPVEAPEPGRLTRCLHHDQLAQERTRSVMR